MAVPAGFGLSGGDAPSPNDLDEQISLALTTLAARWDALKGQLDDLATGRLRERWLVPLLRELGFSPEFARGLTVSAGRFAVTHLGWAGAGAPPMILDRSDLDAKRDGNKRSAHDEMQVLLNESDAHRWGVVANGRRLRMVRDFHHRRTRGYVEFDLDAIFESKSYPDFLCLFRLCHASRLVTDEDGKEPLERLYERSLDAGVAVGQKLRPQVQQALETIANGVATTELKDQIRDPVQARAFHRELLVLLYRLLFLLFAERRGLLPNRGVYAESYAVSPLRELAGQPEHVVEPRRGDLWEGLKVTFRALATDAAEAIGAFPFNGPLFDEERTPVLSASRCDNRALLRAIRAFTTIELEGVRQYVNFADLGVEEIGSVYESLLDYMPVVGDGGRIELQPTSDERSDLGSYYTPRDLVDLMLAKSLDTLIDERLAVAGPGLREQEQALLDIKVLDPACGSAAFLMAAVDRLAGRLAEVRREAASPHSDEANARRDVLQHCIYAVDKDETAVELAKVALWIHCAVEDHPLTFLDHRIQHGDSLVGWPLLGPLPRAIPDEAFEPTTKDSPEERRERRSWRDLNRARQLGLGAHPPPPPDVHLSLPDLAAPEDSPGDVHRKADAYWEWRESPDVQRLERAANLWTAAFLWSHDAGFAPTSHEYWHSLVGDEVAQQEYANPLAADVPFFHWALRFPEIRVRGGFDCVIGNPPWEQFESREKEWFASRAPEVAALPGALRKAAIDALAQSNARLHAAWRRYLATNERMGEWARRCGRFTDTGGKPNTYLLFAEHNADVLRSNGRAGVLLKSQFALDRSASAVFCRLIEAGRLEELHDVVNGGPTGTNLVFPNVDAKERFSVVTFVGAATGDDGFDATVMNWNLEELATRMPRRFTMETLRTLNPKTRTLTSFRRNEELEVALEIHRRFSTLDFEDGGENPWDLEYCTLYNAATDSGLFCRREALERDGWTLGRDKIFRRGGRVALPLYEGQLVNRYDHRAKTYEGFEGNKYGRAPGIPATTNEQKADPAFEIEPRYWMDAVVVRARLSARVGERVILGFGNSGRPFREQRSAAGALMPQVPATHGLPILVIPISAALEFAGLFNSTSFDFLLRGRVPSQNVAQKWILDQIAVPAPGLDPRIACNAARLSLTSQSVAEMFDAVAHQWDAAERYQLDVETDALVAHAYGLDRESYAIVLDSFEVMARMQVNEHGYYKLKDDCLVAFDSAAAVGPSSRKATVGST